jgi:hypothetical protein
MFPLPRKLPLLKAGNPNEIQGARFSKLSLAKNEPRRVPFVEEWRRF